MFCLFVSSEFNNCMVFGGSFLLYVVGNGVLIYLIGWAFLVLFSRALLKRLQLLYFYLIRSQFC